MPTLKDFADLKPLRQQLKDQEEARIREEAERAERERARLRDSNLFLSNVRDVQPLPESNRVPPGSSPPPLLPRVRTEEEMVAPAPREALSDQFEVDALMAQDPTLSFVRSGVGADVVRKMRRGHWRIQSQLDLHGLRRDDARDQLGEFLRQAIRRNQRCVRVIHGKGLGSPGQEPVLKSMVHSWLVQKDEVIGFCTARPSDGGDGALVVLLKAALQTRR
jgi:DNA-nicking Smr family endonuclease